VLRLLSGGKDSFLFKETEGKGESKTYTMGWRTFYRRLPSGPPNGEKGKRRAVWGNAEKKMQLTSEDDVTKEKGGKGDRGVSEKRGASLSFGLFS